MLKFSGTKLRWGAGSGQKSRTVVGGGIGKFFAAPKGKKKKKKTKENKKQNKTKKKRTQKPALLQIPLWSVPLVIYVTLGLYMFKARV